MLKCKQVEISVIKSTRDIVDTQYSIELKIDGSREVWINNTLYSARAIDHNARYNHIYKAIKDSGLDCILDGEIALGEDSNVLAVNKKENWSKVTYYVFDILKYDGKDVSNCSLAERQILLRETIKKINSPYVQMVRRFEDVVSAWDYVLKYGLEGLVLKKLTSIYQTNGDMFQEYRVPYWYKVKNWKETKEEIVDFVGGSTKGALVFRNGGKVSSLENGVGEIALRNIRNGKRVFAEIFFMMKTTDNKLFQPKLKRLVEDNGDILWESGW